MIDGCKPQATLQPLPSACLRQSAAGFATETLQAERDPAVGDDIARGRVKLTKRFRDKSVEILCIINAWVLYRPAAAAQARGLQPASP